MSFLSDAEDLASEYAPIVAPLSAAVISALKAKKITPEFVTQLTKLVMVQASDQIVKDEIAKHQ